MMSDSIFHDPRSYEKLLFSTNVSTKVEKDPNYKLMLDYLATFTGNLPTQAEVEARGTGPL